MRPVQRASGCLLLLEERTYGSRFATAGFDPDQTWAQYIVIPAVYALVKGFNLRRQPEAAPAMAE